ncbi:FADL390Wp [Eremothecium gossypii FDAG1]|nr:FADL390Wp [Eremothecium gossypii FDAG1]
MNWEDILCAIFCSLFFAVVAASELFSPFSFNKYELEHYKNEIRSLFYHGYDQYLQHGYPFDEVRPISCVPNKRNFQDPYDISTNDVLGNFTTTLIDSLTTIAVMGDVDKFLEGVELVNKVIPADFSLNVTVQVFETTIRLVAGLMSAHLYAVDPTKKVYLGSQYDGHLLAKAKKLADRLLPAYLTETGLPVPRVNLANGLEGVPEELLQENNAAASASPMLEFTMLSYLTFDEKYRLIARYAFNKTWSLRSDLNLLPMSFNPHTEDVYHPMTGVGASIDSFYEYAIKGSILFDDSDLHSVWETAYYALSVYSKSDWFFQNVHTATGDIVTPWIDSLSMFFPMLQVLHGDIADAELKNLMSLKLWNTYGGIPERWLFTTLYKKQQVTVNDTVQLEWYPLRPEFVESTYSLYRATKDAFYLNIGRSILQALSTRFKTKCGFAGIQNVITGEPHDRMESFVLGETLKYLYLLFDVSNELHTQKRTNQIFSTEAHPLWLTASMKARYEKNKYCENDVYIQNLRRLQELDQLKSRANSSTAEEATIPAPDFKTEDSEESLKDRVAAPILEASHVEYDHLRGTCRPLRRNKSAFYDSHLLNHFHRLFEIDYRYNVTLLRPHWMRSQHAIELESGFYRRWSTAAAQSQLATNTVSLELILDGANRPLFPPQSTRDCFYRYFPALRCSRLRVERITPNATSSYGLQVAPAAFCGLSYESIAGPACDRSLPEFLLLTAVDGQAIAQEEVVLVDYEDLFGPHALHLKHVLGYNAQHQLLLNCVPVVNVYVQWSGHAAKAHFGSCRTAALHNPAQDFQSSPLHNRID